MIDAQAVEDGGVQVVNVHRVGDDVVAEVVGLTVDHPRLDAGMPAIQRGKHLG